MYRLSDWLRRELLTLILTAALIAVGLTFALASHGLRDLLVLRHYRDRLEIEREHEQTQNHQLQDAVAKLQSDDAYIQRTIRRELGFARPNELIYRFPSDNPRSSSGSAP